MKTQCAALAMVSMFLVAGCLDNTGLAPVAVSAAPSLSISVSPAAPYTGGMASFSSDGIAGSGERTWDFGDGSQASGVDVGHVYVLAGTFSVSLTMGDGRHVTTSVKVSDPHKPQPDTLP